MISRWTPWTPLYFYEFCFFRFHTKWDHTVLVFLYLNCFTPSRFVHVVPNGRSSFFLMAEQYSIVYMYMYHIFIHLSIDRHLDCFHILATVTNTAINMGAPISLHDTVFISFWYVPRSRITGSYGISIFLFIVESPYKFSKLLHKLTSPLTVHRFPLYCTSSVGAILWGGISL